MFTSFFIALLITMAIAIGGAAIWFALETFGPTLYFSLFSVCVFALIWREIHKSLYRPDSNKSEKE